MEEPRLVAGAAASLLLAGGLLLSGSSHASAACNLGNNVKQVVFIVFDNVHLRRDNPNVPSDLEQMPHLRDFLVSDGTLSDNHQTSPLAQRAPDVLTILTGLHGDRTGVPIASFQRLAMSASGP